MLEKDSHQIDVPSVSCPEAQFRISLVFRIFDFATSFVDFETHQTEMLVDSQLAKTLLPIHHWFHDANHVVLWRGDSHTDAVSPYLAIVIVIAQWYRHIKRSVIVNYVDVGHLLRTAIKAFVWVCIQKILQLATEFLFGWCHFKTFWQLSICTKYPKAQTVLGDAVVFGID